MSDHDSFLQAILAHPDDDHLRLVYADWLEERADPRGEFIRVQMELAQPDLDRTRRTELQKREHELWAEHHHRWLGPLAAIILRARFRRGFVDRVEMTTAQFIEHADEMFASAPVDAVTLHPGHPRFANDELADIAECAALSRLRHLGFAPINVFPTMDTYFSTPAIHSLVSSPHVANLRSLRFDGSDLTITEVRELTAAPLLANLERLALDGNERLGDLAPAALIAAPHLHKLDRLSLARCGITASGLAVLARSPFLAQLTGLRLDQNRFGNEGVRALANSRHVGALRILRLQATAINAIGVVSLCRSANLTHLEKLDLSGNPISDLAVELTKAQYLAKLRDLNLRWTNLTDAAKNKLRAHFGDRVQF